ncbi:hypothetical protein JKA74_08925 [Marivirga sp. S37H4]|uniref:Bacterial bifunctional deaminase-reductase C-terminal domain-containing protein n=1 Tax=Marivirga aurantiaca TaxID=2802615 RepID=A0A934WY63_9BACT|nr:hypothetical protein [Marivirga aurantiaca]
MIDEYRLIVNPIVLREGTPLFKNIRKKLGLKLIDCQSFKCGNILLIYHPKK